MNDLKDIRKDPEKYRQMMTNRGKDPAEIDELLELDEEARLAKTIAQNSQSQANIHTDIFALSKNSKMPAELKAHKVKEYELKLEVLKQEMIILLEKDIELCDKRIAAAEATIKECDAKIETLLAPIATELEAAIEAAKREKEAYYNAIGTAHNG